MVEKFTKHLRALYPHISDRVRVYDELSWSFETTSGVRKGCPISSFLSNFVIDEVIEDALDFQDVRVDLTNKGRTVA